MVTPFDKALAALIVNAIIWLVGLLGLHIDPGTLGALSTVLTPIIVYLVPNKLQDAPVQ